MTKVWKGSIIKFQSDQNNQKSTTSYSVSVEKPDKEEQILAKKMWLEIVFYYSFLEFFETVMLTQFRPVFFFFLSKTL